MKEISLESYLSDLKEICAIDSGHHNGPGAEAVADFFETRYRALGLQTERRYDKDNTVAPFLLVSNSQEEDFDVLFIAHMDTVFPVGTAGEWPLTELEPGIISAPGCADCKGGCLLLYYTIRALMEEGKLNFRFRIAMNSDEERRSDYSRAYFEELGRHTKYCFVYEPGRSNDEFVYQRKGSISYRLKCYGVLAHADVEPEKGASAIVELARWVNELDKLVDYENGTSLNIGAFHGGNGDASVSDYAECSFCCCYLLKSAEEKLEALLQRMQTEPFDSRTRIEPVFVYQRPAMKPIEATYQLLNKLEKAGNAVGQKPTWLATGGGSDGNFVSAFGVPVLDGCGPCGGKLHTRDEYLKTASVAQRHALMCALLEQLFP